MGGPCEVLVETQDEDEAREIAGAVASCAWRIERKFSRYLAGNVVARINANAGLSTSVDEETSRLLNFAAQMHRLSGGLFDITSGVLRRAWTFDGGSRTPARAQIDALLPLVGWEKVLWNGQLLTLRPGMQIDLGGIAKEYAVDQAVLAAARISSAAVLVNFGGDLAVSRCRDHGQSWRVGIEGLDGGTRSASPLVNLKSGALATSGDTHRYVWAEGRRLPHILDPRTGSPVTGAPSTVTVAAPTCTHAGMLSTLAMLRGAAAEDFLAAEGVTHWVQRAARDAN